MGGRRLLERENELALLDAALVAARRGEGRTIVVEAAPGLGKSALLDAAAERATGLAVQRAAGVELERDYPLGLAVRLLGPAVRRAGDGVLRGTAGLAAPLFHGDAPDADEPALLHALQWIVANLAETDPLALVVDDAHWSDRPSLALLHRLAVRTAELPLLLLVAQRPASEQVDRDLLTRLLEAPAAEILTPRPLSAAAVAEAAAAFHGRPVDATFTSACHEATGGNPLLVRELLQALSAEGVAPDADAAPRALAIGPQAVMRAVYLALARLPQVATDLARALAVLGDHGTQAEAAVLAGLDASEAAAVCASLERAGILGPGPEPRFLHPILRSAVLEELSPAERAQAHRLAARMLHGRADVDRVAAHLLAARPGDEPWAAETLHRAGELAARRGHPASAVRYLRRSLEERPGVSLVERADVLADLGRAEARIGAPEAVEHLRTALEVMPYPRERAQLALEAAAHLVALGDHPAAADLLERTLADFHAPGDDLWAELQAAYVSARLWDPAGGTDCLDRVDHLLTAEAPPRTPGERGLLATLAVGEMLRLGDREHAVTLALRAWGEGAFLLDLGPNHVTLPSLGATLTGSGRPDLAAEIADAALEAARRAGSPHAFGVASYLRAWSSLWLGEVDAGLAHIESALRAEREDGWEQFIAPNRWICGLLLRESGQAEVARRMVELPPADEARMAESPLLSGLQYARGLLALDDGDWDRALVHLRAAGRLFEDVTGVRNPGPVAWRSAAALALARLGQTDESLGLAEEELARVRAYGDPRAVVIALRGRALIAPRDEAIDLLAEAVATGEGAPCRLEHAWALADHGAALRRAGRRVEARVPLRRALDFAVAGGAGRLAARVREELEAAGSRPRRERLSGPAALTPSERRVASLAARGHSNREIAEALFVTRKAVEYHLANVYRKLDIARRTELAAALREPDD